MKWITNCAKIDLATGEVIPPKYWNQYAIIRQRKKISNVKPGAKTGTIYIVYECRKKPQQLNLL